MASPVGSLVVELAASTAKFQEDMGKATRTSQATAKSIEQAFSGLKTVFGALGLGIGIHEIVAWGESVLRGAETLHELSLETGSSVESLSKLENVAILSGKSLDSFRPIIERFTAGMGGADENTTRVGEALKLLGVTTRDPIKAMEEAGRALNKFADGANKAAIARELFGKGGVAYLATLQQLGDGTGILSTKTDEQIRKATELQEAWRTLTINSHQLADAFLGDIVPALSRLINDFLLARQAGEGFFAAFLKIGTNRNTLAEQIDVAQRKLDDTIKAAEAGKNRTLLKFVPGLVANEDDVKAAEASLRALQAIRLKELGGGPNNAQLGGKPQAPALPKLGAAGAVDNTARRLLDQQLKEQERAIHDSEGILKDHETFLQGYYKDNLISLQSFNESIKAARDASTQKTIDAYDKEIAILEAYKVATTTKPEDRIRAETQIADAVEKRAQVIHDANVKEFLSLREASQATQEYRDTVAELNAQVLELSGNEREAARIRLQLQTRGLRAKFEVEGNEAGKAALDTIERQRLAQIDLNKASQEYGRTISILGIDQARIALAQQAGSITELDAINKRSDLARQYIGILSQQADEQERIAQTLTGAARDDALQRVKELRLAIDQLAESANELENSFRRTFEDAFASNLTDAITGTKSLAAAFRDMEKQIVASISRIASQNIAESIFGKSGPGGGIGSFFAKLFGGAGTAASAGDIPFAFAEGGYPPVGKASWVGEKGRELFVPRTSGVIIPNSVLSGMRASRQQTNNVNISINVPGNVSRATADQIALQTGVEVQRALGRNG